MEKDTQNRKTSKRCLDIIRRGSKNTKQKAPYRKNETKPGGNFQEGKSGLVISGGENRETEGKKKFTGPGKECPGGG